MTAQARQALLNWVAAIEAAVGDLPGPPAGATPRQMAEWWRALSDVDRQRYLAERPDLVAGVDGLPADVRDRANRVLLDRAIAGAVDERLRQLTVLRDKLGPPGQGNFLLGFDNAGDGRAIVSRGNPDTAANVGTFVPGTGSGLRDLPWIMDQNSAMFDSANRTGDANAATIMWIGYDAPNNPAFAASEQYALDANPGLDRFQQGLAAVNPDAHRTLVGHSYGSTVVGYAARDGGLPVDDIVLVGSPGIGVDSAAQLGIGADRVWVLEDNQDPVADLGWFGTDPGNPEFGATQLAAEPDARKPSNPLEYSVDAHLEYFWNWPQTRQSYENLGDVIAGRPPTHR